MVLLRNVLNCTISFSQCKMVKYVFLLGFDFEVLQDVGEGTERIRLQLSLSALAGGQSDPKERTRLGRRHSLFPIV